MGRGEGLQEVRSCGGHLMNFLGYSTRGRIAHLKIHCFRLASEQQQQLFGTEYLRGLWDVTRALSCNERAEMEEPWTHYECVGLQVFEQKRNLYLAYAHGSCRR